MSFIILSIVISVAAATPYFGGPFGSPREAGLENERKAADVDRLRAELNEHGIGHPQKDRFVSLTDREFFGVIQLWSQADQARRRREDRARLENDLAVRGAPFVRENWYDYASLGPDQVTVAIENHTRQQLRLEMSKVTCGPRFE